MGDLISNLSLGFSVALGLQNLGLAFLGCLVGTLIGVLPGIGPVATIAMLMPLTFGLDPVGALIMLAGIYYGAQYGGSTTAILVNIPGEATSVVTTLDGHAMARKGQAGIALGIAAIGSFFAGTVATLVIAAIGAPLAQACAAIRPRRIFLARWCSVWSCHRAGARLGAEGRHHGRVRLAALDGRPGSRDRPGASHLRAAVPGGRHRFCGAGHGRVRHRRDHAQSRDTENPRRRARRPSAGCCQPGGLAPSIWADRARHLIGADARHPARQRRGAGPICVLHAGKEARQESLALRQWRHRGRGRAGSANNAGAQTAFIPLLTLGIPPNAVMALMVGAMTIHGVIPGRR